MVLRYCLGMIMSVSTLIILSGAATPSSTVNFSIAKSPRSASMPDGKRHGHGRSRRRGQVGRQRDGVSHVVEHQRGDNRLTSPPKAGESVGSGAAGFHPTDAAMNQTKKHVSDWPLTGVCIGLSGFGLSAVPFVGTRYGDWPEAIALAVGLLPLIYLAIHMAMRFNERLNHMEHRLRELEGTQK